jgi:competence protein ComEC
LLDVGQGLAAVVRTQHHTLVYDTGPRFSSEFDAGDAAVVPFLRASGIRAVDMLVVSHSGKDHAGGLQSILNQVPVRQVLWGGLGHTGADGVQRCRQGQRWYWDGVALEVLHPPDEELLTGNDGSCVVRIASPAGSLLLTGDIERRGEQRLVRGAGELQSLILVAPHHGSKSSSSETLVAAVKPRFVLFPVGYRNRFGFPRPEVVERYRARGSTLLDTARHGAITFRLGTNGLRLDTFRQSGRHYWHTR